MFSLENITNLPYEDSMGEKIGKKVQKQRIVVV